MLRITDDNRRWWVLGTMTGSLSMVLIDQTVVGVALPTIQADLDVSQTGLQWVVNAYLLSLAVFVALGGRIGDLLGNERTFRIGAVIFVAASAACGLAASETGIIVARAVQGAGAALMLPASGAIVMNAFAPSERGRAMGVYAGVSMVFLALGPLLGGVLTEWVTWRAVFFINLPVGLAMLAAAHVTMPRASAPPPVGGRIDWVGIPLVVVGLGSLVLALMQSEAWGWGAPQTVGLLIAAAVLLPAFVVWELRTTDPLVEFRLFRNANFSGDNAVLGSVEFALVGISVFGAIWVQDVLGFGPVTAGLSILPVTLPLLVVAPLAGRIYDRTGPRVPVAAGALLVAAALAWTAAVLDQQSYAWVVPGYLALGIGLGLVMTPASTDALNAASVELRSQASGVVQTVRQVGGTIGIAVMGTILANVSSDRITSWVEEDPATRAADVPELTTLLAQPSDLKTDAAQTSPGVLDAVTGAITSGISTAYWVAAGVLLAAALLAATVLRRRLAADAEPQRAVA